MQEFEQELPKELIEKLDLNPDPGWTERSDGESGYIIVEGICDQHSKCNVQRFAEYNVDTGEILHKAECPHWSDPASLGCALSELNELPVVEE